MKTILVTDSYFQRAGDLVLEANSVEADASSSMLLFGLRLNVVSTPTNTIKALFLEKLKVEDSVVFAK